MDHAESERAAEQARAVSRSRRPATSLDARTLAAIATTVLFWASVFAVNRAILRAFSPGHLVTLRFLIASAALLGYGIVRSYRKPALRDLPAIFGMGFLGITVYQLALVYGQRTVTAGSASLIIASESIWIALLAMVLLGERLSVWGWSGSVLSFLGVALIVMGEGRDVRFSQNALLVLLAAVSTSAYFVLQKPYLKRYRAFDLNAYCIWAGTLLALPFTPGLVAAVKDAPADAIIAVAYLGILPGALAYATWTYALSRAPASLAGNTLFLIPPLAIVIAFLWLDELPAVLALLGGAVTVAGVIIVQAWGKARAR